MKWFLGLDYGVRITITLAATALAFWLVWVLHKKAQEQEPVWESGDAQVEWVIDRVPLEVCTLNLSRSYMESTEYAVEQFNGQVGFDLFSFVGEASDECDIAVEEGTIEVSKDELRDAFASAWLKASDPQVGVIVLHMPGDPTQIMLAVAHELGHVVGDPREDDGADARSIYFMLRGGSRRPSAPSFPRQRTTSCSTRGPKSGGR